MNEAKRTSLLDLADANPAIFQNWLAAEVESYEQRARADEQRARADKLEAWNRALTMRGGGSLEPPTGTDNTSLLEPLAAWMNRCVAPAQPAAGLPEDDPLYAKLNISLTPGPFPEGFVRFLGLSGGGKTRRLVEVLYAQPCIMVTASVNGNGGNNAIEEVTRNIISRGWHADAKLQQYVWTALTFCWHQFYEQRIKTASSGADRVSHWILGSSCIAQWMEALPDPHSEGLQDAIALLSISDVSPLLLLDEAQAIHEDVIRNLLSVCRIRFRNFVVTGTGVTEETMRAAWQSSPSAGKAQPPPFHEEPGPRLLSQSEAVEYFSTFAPQLAVLAKKSEQLAPWFNPCRARVAAVAVRRAWKYQEVEGDIVQTLLAELDGLADPERPDGWLSKNNIAGHRIRVFNHHTLDWVLARAFLGATWWVRGDEGATSQSKKDAYRLMEIGVAPLVDGGDRLEEFMVIESLRRNGVVMEVVPKVMTQLVQDATKLGTSAAGLAFEKFVALEIYRSTESHGMLAQMEVVMDVETMLAAWETASDRILLHWPDKYLGPDLIVLYERKLKVIQCKYHKTLPSGEDLKYACSTTDLEQAYNSKAGTVYPKSMQCAAERIRQAYKVAKESGMEAHRVLALKANGATDQHDADRVESVDRGVEVLHLDMSEGSSSDRSARKRPKLK